MFLDSGSSDVDPALLPDDGLRARWMRDYKMLTDRPTNIIEIHLDTFTYLLDFYSELELTGEVPVSSGIEDRVVVAFGFSKPPDRLSEAARIKGWIGPTNKFLGNDRDKGHLIAHCIGGKADGYEINLFSQLRHVNRGWSSSGQRYRAMENYCATNPGTFCFNRPRYQDHTSIPSKLEFGIFRKDTKTFWVEEFEN